MEWMVISALMPSVLQLFYYSFFHRRAEKEKQSRRNWMVCAGLPLAFIMSGILYFFSGTMAETAMVSLSLVPGGVLGLITGLFFGAWAIRGRVEGADERR
ncbi:hypothetical protein LQR31_14275 [Chromobacterium vaccinii]|uniref:hypothetical protein n=1 Tax=Chromobacterium vaccinii TaxID=1108595 RepID=UPI001E46A67C|nr:hypothetical protein [Chromobacterium vaccinii]MCD4485641.1 hypothetical protein [Chromobacterium vaccinii]